MGQRHMWAGVSVAVAAAFLIGAIPQRGDKQSLLLALASATLLFAAGLLLGSYRRRPKLAFDAFHSADLEPRVFVSDTGGRKVLHCRIGAVRLRETNGTMARDVHVRVVAMEPAYKGDHAQRLPELLHLGHAVKGPMLETVTANGQITAYLGTAAVFDNGESVFSGPLIPLSSRGFTGPMSLKLEAWCGSNKLSDSEIEVTLADLIPSLDPRLLHHRS